MLESHSVAASVQVVTSTHVESAHSFLTTLSTHYALSVHPVTSLAPGISHVLSTQDDFTTLVSQKAVVQSDTSSHVPSLQILRT